MTEPNVFPVILSGGTGTRLWPLSREALPKQFLPLNSPDTMFVETARRVTTYSQPVTVICSHSHRFIAHRQLTDASIAFRTIILEPVGRNTAAAIAVAAASAIEADPNAILLVTPSDHAVANATAFKLAADKAILAASMGYFATLGVVATRPETGYGYIKAGSSEIQSGVLSIDRFTEKPSASSAEEYVAAGDCFWNAGIFALPARLFLDELSRLEPLIAQHAIAAWRTRVRDLDFQCLNDEAFSKCPSLSVDVAVMERTKRGAVVPASMGWSDVGAWDALWHLSSKDSFGNAIVGDVITEQSSGCYVRSERGRLTATLGLQDAIVINTEDAVLVAHRAHAQNVRHLVDRLKQEARSEYANNLTVHRPWGSYKTIDSGDRFLVKQIMVLPGAALSLQYHTFRAEHWVVVEGIAKVTRGEKVFTLRENESTYIAAGEVHRLQNVGSVPLRIIEVQTGSQISETDIVRLDDNYGRAPNASSK